MRLADLVVIEDGEILKLMLPKQWGIDDISVIIQDKKSNTNRQIDYRLDVITTVVDWFSDTLLTNDVIYPQHVTPRGWLRLCLLNGCNARSLNFVTSDSRPLYTIASDGSLLSESVKMDELPVLMGERLEVLAEINNNKPFNLVMPLVSQMGMVIAPFDKPHPVMRVQPTTTSASDALPDTLGSLPTLPSLEGLTVRKLQPSMDPMPDMMGIQMLMEKYSSQVMVGMDHSQMTGHMGHDNMSHINHSRKFDLHHTNKINGQAFDMNKSMFVAAKGQYERRVISSAGDMMLHPFHIHGTQFCILSEDGKPLATYRTGWENTVKIESNVSEVLMKFSHDAPKEHAYMAHCHLLEHEDTGMILGFTV